MKIPTAISLLLLAFAASDARGQWVFVNQGACNARGPGLNVTWAPSSSLRISYRSAAGPVFAGCGPVWGYWASPVVSCWSAPVVRTTSVGYREVPPVVPHPVFFPAEPVLTETRVRWRP